jgi:hypothetical protein
LSRGLAYSNETPTQAPKAVRCSSPNGFLQICVQRANCQRSSIHSANTRAFSHGLGPERTLPGTRGNVCLWRQERTSEACFARKARATSMLLGTSPGQASPSARTSANNTGRVASGTTLPASRTIWRPASTPRLLKPGALRLPRAGGGVPRRARSGASSRRATRLRTPSRSPLASARGPAVISESIGIPPHL